MNELETQNQTEPMTVMDGIERAQIDVAIATANKYNKHTTQLQINQVKTNMMNFATLDEETASACFYTLPRGDKTIQGPGVRLAEIALSCYGNLRAGSRIVSIDANGTHPSVTVQSVCHDLERNVSVSIEKRRRINAKKDWKTGGKKPIDDDDINLAVNGCTAIAFRDAVFKVVPMALIKPVYEAAKKVAVGQASSLVEKRGKIIDRLKQMGVQQDRILSVLEVNKVEDITLEHLEILVGLGTSIKDGELTIEHAFPAPVVKTKVEEPKLVVVPKVEAKPEPQASQTPKARKKPEPEPAPEPTPEPPPADDEPPVDQEDLL